MASPHRPELHPARAARSAVVVPGPVTVSPSGGRYVWRASGFTLCPATPWRQRPDSWLVATILHGCKYHCVMSDDVVRFGDLYPSTAPYDIFELVQDTSGVVTAVGTGGGSDQRMAVRVGRESWRQWGVQWRFDRLDDDRVRLRASGDLPGWTGPPEQRRWSPTEQVST